MNRWAVIPEELQSYYDEWKMAPGHVSGDHLFVTGFTGTGPDGQLSDDPETQMRNAFNKVGLVLREAGLDFAAVVEMTTYHVGLKKHVDLFRSVRDDYVKEPYPAWTAIEVAGFIQDGALVEISVVASTDGSGTFRD